MKQQKEICASSCFVLFATRFKCLKLAKLIFCITIFINILLLYQMNREFSDTTGQSKVSFILQSVIGRHNQQINTLKKRKIILLWTKFFDDPFDLSQLDYCPELNCLLTDNVTYVNESDAVVFHLVDFNSQIDDIPEYRDPNQRYVFYVLESPVNVYFSDKIPPGFFNWTMTYRLDSDIFAPYGYLAKNDSIINRPINRTEILGKNKKLLVWMASNCYTSSKREEYVEELSKYISIDIYGSCGNLSCSKDTLEKCEKLIDENYKFYLAFENSICVDYITEKFYSRAFYNSIPIVLKRNIVEHILPKHSFIAADDFSHPKLLANFLHLLTKNDTMYLTYFQWRTEGYTLVHLYPGHYENFCQLCQKLWNDSEPVKVYGDIESWWSNNTCDTSFINKFINKENISSEIINNS